jgi:hypothetical protein
MPEKPFQLCAEPGCMERTRARHCPKHATDNTAVHNLAERDKRKHDDKIWSLYYCAAWTKRFRPAFLGTNPICQRILADGTQCQERATECHHIISPRQAQSLMYSWSNVKALCAAHHDKSQGGEPPENLGKLDKIYVETNLPAWMRGSQ